MIQNICQSAAAALQALSFVHETSQHKHFKEWTSWEHLLRETKVAAVNCPTQFARTQFVALGSVVVLWLGSNVFELE